MKRTKDELIVLVMDFAEESRITPWELETSFSVEPPHQTVGADGRPATLQATPSDGGYIYHYGDSDRDAYERINRDCGPLSHDRPIKQAMELMSDRNRHGSCRVQRSDEELMTHEIEVGPLDVLQAVTRSNLPATSTVAWCREFERTDRVGLIVAKEIGAVRNRFPGRLDSRPALNPVQSGEEH